MKENIKKPDSESSTVQAITLMKSYSQESTFRNMKNIVGQKKFKKPKIVSKTKDKNEIGMKK